jgi:phosphoglycolate phosphatase-like HAD superfamily hydrolase
MSLDGFGRQLELPEERIQEFVRLMVELFASDQRPPRIFAGIRDVVVRLSAGCKIGIVTGNTAEAVSNFLDHHRLSGVVDVVLDVNAEGSRSEKIVRVAEGIGEPSSQICVIGDAVSDIRAARQASAVSIAVTWGHQSRERLEKARPDYLVHSPTELYHLLQST